MKKTISIFAFISSVLTSIIAILPISNFAIIPGIITLILIAIVRYSFKKQENKKELIPFIFFLTLAALSLSAYKAVFTNTTVGDTNQLEEKIEQSKNEAIEELETLEIDINELEDIEIE